MFKVGDWVRIGDTVQRIIAINPENDYNITIDMVETDDDYVSIESIELWQPKEGEWCWYKHNLVRIEEINEYGYVRTMSASFCNKIFFEGFKDCEPFIGELPSFIKGK